MGCNNSKVSEDENLPVVDATAYGSEIIIESEDIYDRQVISCIKSEIERNPERFLLNNLLMSVVFFKNYEKELYDFSNTATPKEESDLNAELVTEVKKCILPDSLSDRIQENIRFCDSNDGHEEPLTQKIIYVINDNIEVKDKNDETLYTPVEVPGCQVKIEDFNEDADSAILLNESRPEKEKEKEKERKGFLKLRVLGRYSSKMNTTQFASRSVLKPPEKESSKPTTPVLEELELGEEYSTITAFKTPRDLNIVRRSERRDTLPDICFEVRKVKKFEDVKENESEEEESEEEVSENEILEERQKKQTDLYEDVTYLSSSGFMEYFQNDIFPNSTAKILGFTEEDVASAKAMPGCILCNKNQKGKVMPYQIIPAVAIDWPAQAYEYSFRKSRKVIIDTKDGIVYKWPTNGMIRELKSLNCVVIPKGFVMKKGENENSDIEWEINFPKASRYLAMRMSHPQVRCYIFLLALYKTYIEKFTMHHGLLIEHIRIHMFWECESDAKNWPEHKMGTKILQVIEDLNSGLSRCKIPDYFIKGKNIFENIPSKYLQFAQKKFHDILQFPVMHFIEALKNIKFINQDFYPAPDLDQLYNLLEGKKGKPPSWIRRSHFSQLPRKSVAQLGSQKEKHRQIQDLKWKKAMEKHNRNKYMQKMKDQEEAEKASKKKNEKKDLELFPSKLDILTQISILKFFTNHFLEIAKKSSRIGPKSQTIFYLKQAWYNMKVLEDIGGVCTDTENIEKVIDNERKLLEEKSVQVGQNIAPPTPHRNNENPFSFHENDMKANNAVESKSSFKLNKNNDIAARNREKRLMRERRPKSVGFDDKVEKISFMQDM
ncbi:hypothetical protein HHI36_009311 [Cryptolaemus montrouzieri]|uniref:Mab-21-like HhH/H2TH-like domain-containing protein n=1 Tax=Cryptolaemus montrouzieri TaxID=559131 RepID=A0ABD2MUV9_9CUCU